MYRFLTGRARQLPLVVIILPMLLIRFTQVCMTGLVRRLAHHVHVRAHAHAQGYLQTCAELAHTQMYCELIISAKMLGRSTSKPPKRR